MAVFPLQANLFFGKKNSGACLMLETKIDAHLYDIPYQLCKLTMTTSPCRDMLNDDQKLPVPNMFFMPL
jgi:hypothetical protein